MVIYAKIMQFDAATGKCMFLLDHVLLRVSLELGEPAVQGLDLGESSATRSPIYGKSTSPGAAGAVSKHLSAWMVSSCQTMTLPPEVRWAESAWSRRVSPSWRRRPGIPRSTRRGLLGGTAGQRGAGPGVNTRGRARRGAQNEEGRPRSRRKHRRPLSYDRSPQSRSALGGIAWLQPADFGLGRGADSTVPTGSPTGLAPIATATKSAI